MKSILHNRILRYIAHPSYIPARADAIAQGIGVENPDEVVKAIDVMRTKREVDVDGNDLVRLPSIGRQRSEQTGVFKRGPRGSGFFSPEVRMREGDIYIPPGETQDASSGDRVVVEIARDRGRERKTGKEEYFARVLDVLERKRSVFTGEVEKRGPQWIVFPDGRDIEGPIVVRDAESRNVKPGDKVAFEIVQYAEDGALGEGVISKVLGEAGKPTVETQAVIATYNLFTDFPAACVEEARMISAEFDEEIAEFERRGSSALTLRRDLTGDFICTIDPPDAKDYDDAISIKRLGSGGWELGVHIADVGHFVRTGSALDEEAKKRGNSTYLPRLVLPMLPELLSNGICSLQEGVPRYVKSAFIRYNTRGEPIAEGTASCVIKSAKRLTYLEAQALIDGNPEEAKKHAKTEPNYSEKLLSTLREMNSLSRAIQDRRRRDGMISLELPESELVYDENGHVIDAVPEDDAFTHTLIEMFMVEANEVLARLFERMGVPLIRRIHEEPIALDTEAMSKVANVAGYRIPANPSREELQGLLDATRGTPAARAVHMAVLRTLTRARYSPQLIGHFALASEAYAHFTSPIRRYADLTVHRSLAAYLARTDNGENRPRSEEAWEALGKELSQDDECPSEADLSEISGHITMTEDNSESAERELRMFLVLQLLVNHIGDSLPGVVTGVTPRGIFVQIDKYLVDGMVKASDLPGDVTRSNKPPRWGIDQKSGALVDANSGRSFGFGDRVEVTIASVDLAKRRLDLAITNAEARAAGKAKTNITLGGGIGGGVGGLGPSQGAGFKPGKTGAERRSARSKSRDRNKKNHRRDR